MSPNSGDSMKTSINQSKKGNSIMVKFEEGFSTYTLAVPMPYATSFFLKGLLASLALLQQKKELQKKLDEKEGMKSEVLEGIRQAISIYDGILNDIGR